MTKRRRPPGDETRAVAYVRTSTEDQSLGIAAQRKALKQWASTHEIDLVAIHEDRGVSGAAPIEKRVALLQALEDVKDHSAGTLVVLKRDRLARDTILAAMIERLTERAGARVVAVNGAGNGVGPEAVLMRRMIDAFSEYERALIRARTRAALAVKKSQGERVGDPAYGYRIAPDGRHLEPDPAERTAVQLAAEYRREGLSYRAIGERLVAAGHHPRRGGSWHTQTVARLVRRAEEYEEADAA